MELPASEVTMYKGTENNLETPPYIYYFRYVPYLFLAVLSYSMGYVLLAFQKEDILNECAPQQSRCVVRIWKDCSQCLCSELYSG